MKNIIYIFLLFYLNTTKLFAGQLVNEFNFSSSNDGIYKLNDGRVFEAASLQGHIKNNLGNYGKIKCNSLIETKNSELVFLKVICEISLNDGNTIWTTLERSSSSFKAGVGESTIIDATGKTLGRFASKIADILSGKNKPEYTPNADLGDYVIVINAGEINVTGKKLDQKIYYRHSGYPGGIKSKPLRKVIEETPTEAIKSAVKGMLPKSKLGRQMLTKLKVYSDENHPHSAQKPIILEL